MDIRKIYETKRDFVKSIEEILMSIGEVTSCEYRSFPDKYMEILRVSFPGCKPTFVDVTADNCKCIYTEIARVVNSQKALGQVDDIRLYEKFEEWWNESSQRYTKNEAECAGDTDQG